MEYNTEYWNKYTEKSESQYNEEFAKFIRDLVVSLRCNSVLEVGCNAGNALRLFPENFEVHGIDLNGNSLERARKNLPSFKFQNGSVTKIPFEDSSIDFVFTHMVLNYIPAEDMPKAISEMFRVSKKYLLTCELFDENESPIEDEIQFWNRNVCQRWLDYKVRIISDVDMHEEIDPKKTRFTLVKKLQS